LLARFRDRKPTHAQEWESTAVFTRGQLRQLFGEFPRLPKPVAKFGKTDVADRITTTQLLLQPELNLPLFALLKSGDQRPAGRQPVCLMLHLDGKAEAVKHPLAAALLAKDWAVVAPDLRACGEARPPRDAFSGAPDHNSA
jgi:hypothetical protein